MEKNSICLIDGSGYIFRAFYAVPSMINPNGVPVNAVFGFITMLLNLLNTNKCSHIVVIFDSARHNFRNEIYPDYKANRSDTPEELKPQFSLIRSACEALNIPWIEQAGFEADDLIATYARIGVNQGYDVQVVSSDKDLMQLMREHVSMYDPMKKKHLTNEDVFAKFGVTPDKVVDVQALMGDSTDNIPGAMGVGPKTAAELINQFGNLSSLLDRLDEVKSQKRQEGLIRDKEKILISKQLVKLDDFVPCDENLARFQNTEPDMDVLTAFLSEHNFKSLMTKVSAFASHQSKTCQVTAPASTINRTTYETIQNLADLQKWVELLKKQPYFAIDTETNSLDAQTADLVGISLAIKDKACYIPLLHGAINQEPVDLFDFNTPKIADNQLSINTVMTALAPVLADKNIIKVGHNIKYDLHVLLKHTPTIAPIGDSMILSYILNGTQHGHGMDELAKIYLNHDTIKYSDLCGTGKNQITFDQLPIEKAAPYASEDADITYRLYTQFIDQIDDESKYIYYTIDMPLVPILYKMEKAGIMIDVKQLNELKVDFAHQLSNLTQQIYDVAGCEFNVNSPAQLGELFFEKMGLPGGKKSASGQYKTDVTVLENLAQTGNELATLVLEYRALAKLQSTYVDALLTLKDKNNRVHTSFMQTVTNTGRLSSNNPNLQNIPIRSDNGKKIRSAFIAKPGYKLICADYSQIELRLLADLADIKNLKNSFLNNEDIHARTASEIFKIPLNEVTPDIRRQAKAINFGIVYGISAFGLANQLDITRTQAKEYIDAYFAQYPEIKTYMDTTTQFALDNGYVLTPMGRKCTINGMENGKTRGFATRAAINAPIQGGSADLIKLAMQKIDTALSKTSYDATLLLQIHDELIYEVKESDTIAVQSLIKQEMQNAVTLSIPLIVDANIADNWKDGH